MRKRAQTLDAREEKLSDKEKELDERQSELGPRETNVAKKEKELASLDSSLRVLQDDLNAARVTIEKRDKDLTEKETMVLALLERSQEYDTAITEFATKYQALEEKVLADERSASKVLEETSARREEVLVKIKVLQEQEALLAESKKLVMAEQRRFVEWERQLNAREVDLGTRERSLERSGSIPKFEAAPMPGERKERAPERRSEPEPEPEEIRAKEEARETVEESEEAGLAEAFCPECRTIVSASADTCYACGADLKNPRPPEAPKNAPKAEEKPEPKKAEPKPEEKAEGIPAEGEAKKSVSIRKIIKRK